jgi:pyruvate dehydrogenase E2 component (dihydrolipoamide acetyltransferase)
MATNILMPALSPTMTEGTLARWLKREGDTIVAGDVIAEIETDKATMEVEAVDEGVLGRILVVDGTANVAVNAPIAILVDRGEAVPDGAAAGGPTTVTKTATPALPPKAATSDVTAPRANGHDAKPPAPAAHRASPSTLQ